MRDQSTLDVLVHHIRYNLGIVKTSFSVGPPYLYDSSFGGLSDASFFVKQ